MEEKIDLQKKSQEGLALSELKNHHGYKEFINILQGIYNSAFEKLVTSEDVEARMTIKVLQEIVSIIDDRISLGEQAREELRQGLFIKHTGDTG